MRQTRIIFMGLILLAGCSAQQDDPVGRVFLARLDTLWAAGGASGINAAAGLDIKKVTVHEGGKKIIVNAAPKGGQETALSFALESVRDTNSAYFTNTIQPEAGVFVTRFVGIKISAKTLLWENHAPQPLPQDFPPADAGQAAWDAFNAKYWTKDKVSFTSDYAVIGREI